jgi:hypothetical protein
MTAENRSTDQAQTWFSIKPEQQEPIIRINLAEARSASDEWHMPEAGAAPPLFIPRVYPGL